MVTANKEINKPEDMKGMKLRVPRAAAFFDAGELGRRQRHAHCLRRGLLWRSSRARWTVRKNPLPTIIAKKFYEGAVAYA